MIFDGAKGFEQLAVITARGCGGVGDEHLTEIGYSSEISNPTTSPQGERGMAPDGFDLPL